MDLLNQFETILNKSIKRVVEERNRKRKLAAPYNRVFYWDGVYIITCLSDKIPIISIHLKEESEEMYCDYSISTEVPLKTLLDETLLEEYLKQ
jgi:hypothetical protein